MLLLVLLVVAFIAIISMLFFYEGGASSVSPKPRCCGGRNPNCPMCRCSRCGETKQNCGCRRQSPQMDHGQGCPFC